MSSDRGFGYTAKVRRAPSVSCVPGLGGGEGVSKHGLAIKGGSLLPSLNLTSCLFICPATEFCIRHKTAMHAYCCGLFKSANICSASWALGDALAKHTTVSRAFV